MTSLDPSHIPGLSKKPRTGQAVHHTETSAEDVQSEFPDDIDDLGSDAAEMKARRDGRDEIRRHVPALPDLRFEQSYLLSIRPFLTPTPSAKDVQERGGVSEKQRETKSLVASTEQDSVFHWGREMAVDWRMVGWVTLRDQIVSPLLQGMFWGVAMPGLSAASVFFRQALYPAGHVGKGRIVGGSGGSISEAGGASAVGDSDGYWRKWVRSWGGAVETAAA